MKLKYRARHLAVSRRKVSTMTSRGTNWHMNISILISHILLKVAKTNGKLAKLPSSFSELVFKLSSTAVSPCVLEN